MSEKLNSLNIIGCGKVGKTLARLWIKHDIFEIRDIVTRSMESARSAVNFLGGGTPVNHLDKIKKADIFLIATPDDQIHKTCQALSEMDLIKSGNIVFHCSGALSSLELDQLKSSGAHVASIHPVKSFANPDSACETFDGTFCGTEGEKEALEILHPAFEKIGGIIFSIDAQHKTEYHAANVIVCNYLTALIELGTKVYERSGLSYQTAMQVMEPLVRETVNNNFSLGTVNALTGPIARGDSELVNHQLKILKNWNPEIADLYAMLGKLSLELSKTKGTASEEALKKIEQVFSKND